MQLLYSLFTETYQKVDKDHEKTNYLYKSHKNSDIAQKCMELKT